MRFPAAFLQGIYYNSKRPQYLNFGGIGSLIGHEMTHGFDRQGRNFDDQGTHLSCWLRLYHYHVFSHNDYQKNTLMKLHFQKIRQQSWLVDI